MASQGARGTGGGHLQKARCLGGVFLLVVSAAGLAAITVEHFYPAKMKESGKTRKEVYRTAKPFGDSFSVVWAATIARKDAFCSIYHL